MEISDNYIKNHSEVLPENLVSAFENSIISRSFDKNYVIYSQGEPANYFYYLKSGRVRIFITSPNGAEKTLSTISGGAILGEAAFFDGKPRISSARTLTKCEILTIDKITLTNIIQKNPRIAFSLLKLQAETIRTLSAQLDSISFLTAETRTADFILKNTDEKKPYVKITHEEIGNIIGASRVTVSKIITKFAKNEIIETGYRSITVKNRNKLKNLADSQ